MTRPWAVRLVAVCAMAASAPAARAQEQDAVPRREESASQSGRPDEPGFVTKGRRVLEGLHDRGIYPDAGTIVSGSGLALGVSLRSPVLGRTGIAAEAGTMWSVRGYREHTARLGLLSRMRDTIRLEPQIAEIRSTLNARAPTAPGRALYVDARWFNYRQLGYFGIDRSSGDLRSDFSLSGMGVDAVAQWQPRTDFGVSARAGVLNLDVGPGTDERWPNVEDLFTDSTAPGLTSRPRYRTTGIGAAWDRRDMPAVPTRGVYAGATVWRFSALNDQAPSFTRFTADLRAFYSVATDRHVIAANVIASADRTPGPAPIPFYLQSWLGGSHSLRGFSSYRLRGESLVHAAIEYRWRAHRYVEIAPFMDMGAASATGSSLSDGPLHTALGAGLRLRDDKRVFFRVDWGHSDEGHRLSFSMSPSF